MLYRSCPTDRIGLRLCYGGDYSVGMTEDGAIDIFIAGVDGDSIAGRDGRLQEGDQILQV